AATPVGELDEGRRLEAPPEVAVDAERLRWAEEQPYDRGRRLVGAAAAVVRIARGNEVIVGIEIDVRVARAAMQRPSLRELPFPLHVEGGRVDGVVLVALERTNHAVVVDVAPASLVHHVVLDAGRQAHGAGPAE